MYKYVANGHWVLNQTMTLLPFIGFWVILSTNRKIFHVRNTLGINFQFLFLYKYQLIDVYSTVSWHFIAIFFFKTISEKI